MTARLLPVSIALLMFAAAAADARESVATMRLELTDAEAVAALQGAKLGTSPAGVVELECGTKSDGALDHCRVFSETPSGARLGEAALALSRDYRASAPGAVRVTIPFKEFKILRWRERPDALLFERALRRVKVSNPNGKATLDCLAAATGVLVSCHVASSIPDARYGQAAMLLASNFRFSPATYDGRPVASRTVIPITFRMGS